MSCCGKKRQSLNFFPVINQARVREETSKNKIENKIVADPIFRYTGSGSLEVRGVLGARKYFFTSAKPEINVYVEDAPMLRAIAELVEVKRQRL